MRTGLVLFGLVMAISLLGTVVPGWEGLYHSWPFGLLLGLLVFNTGLCTVRQAPRVFGRRGLSRMETARGWSVWLIHAAVLLVAAGALWSALVSRDGSVELAAGEVARIPADMAGGREHELRLLDLRAEYLADGSPAGWWSRISLDGSPAQEISVNHPLESGGLSILQSSWGSRYRVRLDNPAQPERELIVSHDEVLDLDGSGGLAVILQDPRPGSDLIPCLALINGKVTGTASARIGQPVEVDGQGLRFTILERFETSGLMLRYDPAVPLIWTGFGLLGLAVCGLFIGKGKK